MALTIALAVVVVGLVAIGLRAAAGRTRGDEVTEVPARRDVVPPNNNASPSTSNPQTAPSTTATTLPGSTGTTAPGGTGGATATPPDLLTPRIKFTELDGRFEVTVPRSWVNEPNARSDQAHWVPLAPTPSGGLGRTEFLFSVHWGPSQGCALERCASDVVDRMKVVYPTIISTTTEDSIGALRAIRIDATLGDERLMAWVVVKGDRYWVPQMRGPSDEFELAVPVLRSVVATMSFG